MADFFAVLLLSVAMFVGCMVAGWIPLAFTLSTVSKLQYGMLHKRSITGIILHLFWIASSKAVRLCCSMSDCYYQKLSN